MAPPPAFASYILCATPRSGTTLLCRMLRATGRAGRPASYFHRQTVGDWGRALDLPIIGSGQSKDEIAQVMDAVMERGRDGGPVFGLRLMRKSHANLVAALAQLHPNVADEAALFAAAFGPPLYIHLQRADKVAQAVSLLRAEQSGLWHRHADGAELERLHAPAPPVYDAEALAAHVDRLIAEDAARLSWFAAHRIDPIKLRYETLAADPGAAVSTILAALFPGANAPQVPQPDVAPVSDALNAQWIARFCQDDPHRAARARLPDLGPGRS